MIQNRNVRLWLNCFGMFLASIAAFACDDEGGTEFGIDVVDDASDAGQADAVEDAVPTDAPLACDEIGCADESACTRDYCAEDGETCVNEYDPALCCTSDQCEIDGECWDNLDGNPVNSCEVCVVAADAEAWSADDTATCDDENACTSDDRCVDGACVGDSVSCDDGNACTDDACDADTGACLSVNNTASCDDGDACTLGDQCADGSCVGGGAPTCDDGNDCTDDSCDPSSGCVFTNNSAPCDDGDVCSTSDQCVDGVCTAIASESCDDMNVCTADFCDAETGCGHETLDDLCIDANPCTDESCDPVEGCVYPFNSDPCNDGNACTIVDTCTAGACIGSPVDPDDGNPCTDDTCDPDSGINNLPNALPCDDNDACTVGDTCAAGGCVPGSMPLNCDDSNVCTTDSCDAIAGCVNQDISASCDDSNACTEDSCDAVDGCRNTVLQTFGCRPTITVTTPLRAETLGGPGSSPDVLVAGTVISGAGAITSFTINGATVPVDPSTGAFSYTFPGGPGSSNTLVLEAEDALGTVVERVQAYHWSTRFTMSDPASPGNFDWVVPGLALWLDQETLDDGQAPPPIDFAAIFTSVFEGLDFNSLIPSPVTTINQLGHTYRLYISNFDWSQTLVSVNATDQGIALAVSLTDVRADVLADRVDCPDACVPFTNICTEACVLPNDTTGDLLIDSIDLDATLNIGVSNNAITVTVASSSVAVNNARVDIDSIFDFIVNPIINAFLPGFIGDIENQLNSTLAGQLGPLLEDALAALAFNLSFDLPRLDGATDGAGNPITIPVALASDFSGTDFNSAANPPQGGAIALRARATTPQRGVGAGYPFDDNDGVPMRRGCNTGPQSIAIPRLAPLEVTFPDDTLNQILRAAWWGGLLEFPVDATLLGDVDLQSFGISNLLMDVSAWLPPVASDCGPYPGLRLYAGDLRVDASFELFGQPVDMVVWVSFDAPIDLSAQNGQIAITVQAVEHVELQVNVLQESVISAEGVIKNLLETELVPALGGLLGGGTPLASFPLPEIDLSTALGQSPGTTLLQVVPLSNPPAATRQGGNTVVYGRLE